MVALLANVLLKFGEPEKEWLNKAPERTTHLPRNGYLIIWQSPHSERSHDRNDHLWHIWEARNNVRNGDF